ncbi:P-type ATPase-like protein [Xylogone sp. PMI_703]|nr:P-type ATPase-like protein [Xylogone sp. PMI_703]
MTLQPPPAPEEPNDDATGQEISATKRSRWATQRMKSKKGNKKRRSIVDRIHRQSRSSEKRISGASAKTDLNGEQDAKDDGNAQEPRTIYFNQPLPRDAVDEQGYPLAKYGRNKIRTAKYTPLSFIPKNLFYQFHNIANVYFLFLIILAFFSIFGASNPGLNAVPLIVIVFITAVKDAIEDYRRTVLDNELNNSPVHRLVDWDNTNVASDNVSLWRRIKKATSRGIASTYRSMRKSKAPSLNDDPSQDRGLDEPRASFQTNRLSAMSQRQSYASVEEGIQMTPVPSPLPTQTQTGGLTVPDGPARAFSFGGGDYTALQKAPGNLIDRDRPVTGKPRFARDYWKNVQVGDFVRIYNDDQIPADVIILSTSAPDGACYVETKNLDGETNLKVRQALRCGRSIKHARDCERSVFTIESEGAQPNLYKYSAVAKWTQKDPKNPNGEGMEMAEPISINNLLLRGCNLRNTDWILGVVVFTGQDTKIMLNAGITPSKRSRIARELNWNVVYNFFFLFVICFIAAIVEGVTWGQNNNSIRFFEFGSIGGNGGLNGFITFWAAIILFQNLVPISLFISLEIIKTLQAFFIYSDIEMYYEKLDYPCTPKSWNISDDVGQIEYIFSDKTGTLTQNVMEFKKATINGVPYGEAYTEAQAGMQRRQGIDVEKEAAQAREMIAQARERMLVDLRQLHDNPYLHDEDLTFIAPDFVADLAGESGLEQQQANEQFMLALALCHTVISETIPGDPPRIEFKAQSPDEAALVATARDVGFTVLGNTDDGIRLNVMGQDREYKVLNILEFNSTRKRMSAIIRMPNGQIILFCKGADSIIYSRLKRGEQPELRRVTAEHLEVFAREGLRTLCIAQRILSEEEYDEWNRKHEIAAAAIQEREEKLEEVSDMIERDLTLLGGTAIEDRLQEGVPDTIALLAEAGIKLWVLTGDKVETAINIGFSCNLLNNDMELIILKIEDEQLATAEAELDKHLATFHLTGSDDDLKAAQKNHEPPAPTHALVIDGDSLKLVIHEQLRQKFLLLCKNCKSVLCCRVSPAQKAAVVSMVKNGLDVMTLSIGDGANDVAMIQEADVGVGIAGEEGRQAVMSSDYAIGQFRFLQRLVLVHGRWSYRRLGETIANFFYKNIVWTFSIFWYQIFTNFDMTYLYDYTFILLFNLAFTSLPVIFMGVLDQDVSDKVSLAVPQLYRRGIERKEWTQPKFWLYMLDGMYQSVMVYFVAWLVFRTGVFGTMNGLDVADRERFGVYVAPAAVICCNTYVLLNTYRWDWLMLLLTNISTLLVWFWTGVYSAFESSEFFYKAAPQVFGQASFWAVIALSVTMSLLPRFVIKSIQKVYFPYDVDIIREQVKLGKFDYLEEGKGDGVAASKVSSTSSSEMARPSKHTHYQSVDEDRRPIYPPSVAPTATTHNPRSQNGSDGTEFTRHRLSMDPTMESPVEHYPRSSVDRTRPSMDRARSSYDRVRNSMDRMRASYEASNDFTSAAMLTRLESTHSYTAHNPPMRTWTERPGEAL